MIKITNNSVNGIHDVMEFTLDSKDELQQITKRCAQGSIAIVNDGTFTVYMKNGAGEWVEI